MTTTDDKLSEEKLQHLRAMKEDAAERAAERGTDDMNGIIEVWRDGDPLLTIFTPDIDRDQALNAVWFTIPAVQADRVVLTMDAHLARNPINPNTGEPWAHGEMQEACHQDKMCSSGVITDCLIINDVRRDGTYHMYTLPYHIDEAAKEAGGQPVAVHWNDEMDVWETGGDVSELQGLVPDTIREAFEKEYDLHSLPAPGLTDEERLAATDAAAITKLVIEGYGVALTSSSKEHVETVRDLISEMLDSSRLIMEEFSDAQN